MPGGSVGGRPFREDPTSYDRTGIPRGNPQRYLSTGVLRMAPDGTTKYRHQALDLPPGEKIETEGDRQLQALLHKQLDTNVDLRSQLTKRKAFTEATVFKPVGEGLAGSLSLQQYQSVRDADQRLDELRQCGLTETEIQYKLQDEAAKSGEKPVKISKYGVDPQIHQSRMDSIDRKVDSKKATMCKPDKFSAARYMSRREMDIEQAISHDREKKHLLGCLMTRDSSIGTSNFVHPDDPINHIDVMLQEITRRAETRSSEKKEESSKSGHLQTGIPPSDSNEKSEPSSKNSEAEFCTVELPTNADDDSVQINDPKGSQVSQFKNTNEGEKNMNNPSCKDSSSHREETKLEEKGTCEPRIIGGHIECIPEELIRGNRLSVEQIKENKRFRDYTPGDPNNILFLKNLSKKTNEADLVSLFHRFERPEGPLVVYHILKGRMRGCAFVTLHSIEQATEALGLINGYLLHGQPIVIHYGKTKSPPQS